MKSLTNLPNELLIEIIKEVVPYNKHEPIIGVNASWSGLSLYRQSLISPKRKIPLEESDSISQYDMVLIYKDLHSLRSTCSTMNALSVPFVFKNLDILRDLEMPFEEFYDLIVKPYALYAKTVRIRLSDSVTDEDTARILSVTTNATDLLLYHLSFGTPGSLRGVDWMHNTTTATVNLLENHSLRCLGIYAESITEKRPRWGFLDDSESSLSFLLRILTNPMAFTSLIKLDITLYNIPEKIYDLLRQNLPSLTSLTIYHAFDKSLPRFWDTSSGQHLKWNMGKNLNRLSLKRCTNAYAPHIPHLVQHIPSLKHLLVSSCGDLYSDFCNVPLDGWYSSENALWKIRPPLDTFQIGPTLDWEIEAMAVIPVKNIIILDTGQTQLIRVLTAGINYFPKLEIISVESPNISGRDLPDQLIGTEFNDLEEICQKRGVSVVKSAIPTSLYPLHI